MKAPWLLAAALVPPLVLGGCLLPQPDTPPVLSGLPRGVAKGDSPVSPVLPQPDTPPVGTVAPQAGDVAPNGTATTAAGPGPSLIGPNNGAAVSTTGAAQARDGVLDVTLAGDAVTTLAVIEVATGNVVYAIDTPPDRHFSFTLQAGRYQLRATVAGADHLLATAFEVEPDRTRTYTITLRVAEKGATVAEDVVLEDRLISPTPDAAASNTVTTSIQS